MTVCEHCGTEHLQIHVNWSRATEQKREPAGEFWCFKCRQRIAHDWVLYAEPFPSYYDPWWEKECSNCHNDYTAFPGTTY